MGAGDVLTFGAVVVLVSVATWIVDGRDAYAFVRAAGAPWWLVAALMAVVLVTGVMLWVV